MVFLHFAAAPNRSFYTQVGAQGHFVVNNESKNLVAFLAHLVFRNCTWVIPTPVSSVFNIIIYLIYMMLYIFSSWCVSLCVRCLSADR